MSQIPLHKRFEDFILGCYRSLEFFVLRRRELKAYPNYCFPYRPANKGKKVNILANGPSLNKELSIIMKDEKIEDDSLVVNYFVFSELFFKIQPTYYCLADPLFFAEKQYNDKVYRLFEELNKVTWNMTLFVWIQGADTIKKYVKNKNITIQGVSILTYRGFESHRNECYKKGIAVPSYVNVTIMGIYVLLNLGYSQINLYGVDHTFLKEIVIDDDNELCVLNHHFYGNELRKIIEIRNGIKWGVSEFIYNYYLTFIEHRRMRKYADFLGASIINCTKDSWIDAYLRVAQIEKQLNDNKDTK